MTPDTITEHLRLTAATAAAEADRRRVGRKDVAQELIPLLRSPASVGGDIGAEQSDDTDQDIATLGGPAEDGINPARGLLVGAMMATMFWAAIALVTAALLR